MKFKKRRTVNVRDLWDLDYEITSDGFILIFQNKTLNIRCHFKRYWFTYLANILWKILSHEKKQVANFEDGMKGA